MAYKKGESGNPSGRPPKSRALSDILNKALAKTVETKDGRVSGKRVLAALVAEGVTTGKVTFPGDVAPSTISVKDWIEFVKWAYQYLEPPVTRTDLTTNGENLVIGLEYITRNYDQDTGLSPEPTSDPAKPNEV